MKKVTPDTVTVGFIGTGVMGRWMALHILEAGYRLHVYNRTKAKSLALVDHGAQWHDSVAALSEICQCIITMVGFPKDVKEVYFGNDGIMAHVKPGTLLIDTTTSDPNLAVNIYEQALVKQCHALDAPVSGGDIGARDARLSIMVGGDPVVFETALPLFNLLGKNVVYQGKAGSGQHTKMANQIAIASTVIGVCEAIAYAKKAGLNPKTVLTSIEHGAAGSWSLTHLAPKMIEYDFEPGFYIKHFIKDMNIAQESARKLHQFTPGLDLAKQLYEKVASEGGSDFGTQALFSLFNT